MRDPGIDDGGERLARREVVRAQSRARARRRRGVLAATVGVVLIVAAVVFAVQALSGAEPTPSDGTTGQPAAASPGGTSTAEGVDVPVLAPIPLGTARRLVERRLPALPVAVKDAAAVASGSGALLFGGLTAADTSTNRIVRVGDGAARLVGNLPASLHDAAAALAGSSILFFGGGDGVGQHDAILRYDPAAGTATVVGRLPVPASDVSAATIGKMAYVVGGFDGVRWLDTIVAVGQDGKARVAGHLPVGVRYPAVGAVGGFLVVAGGTLPSGAATAAVYTFNPASGTVRRVGSLPAPTTHAVAAALGDAVYVIGGRGSNLGSATDRIVAVRPAARSVRAAARLDGPRSDLAAVTVGSRIIVAGGTGAAGATTKVASLRLAPAAASATAGSIDVYAADRAGMLTGAARKALPRIYVPEGGSNDLVVIDQATFKIVGRYPMGALPQHVTPSYDLRTLFLSNNKGNSLQAIDPRTGKPKGSPIPVEDPYNLYFTPDGKHAIVVAERDAAIDVRNPHTFALEQHVPVPCRGIDHMDFAADGSSLVASCEFSGTLIEVALPSFKVTGTLALGFGAMPQDVKLSPDGAVYYVADNTRGGLYVISAAHFKVLGFIPTGAGAHGLYPSRNGADLYVSNRIAGTVSVLRFADRRVIATWSIGGSPDMGGVSADGKVLWLSSRYNASVYAISTRTGKVIRRIPVGSGPHGLAVWPQPGRYSLGHTGILR